MKKKYNSERMYFKVKPLYIEDINKVYDIIKAQETRYRFTIEIDDYSLDDISELSLMEKKTAKCLEISNGVLSIYINGSNGHIFISDKDNSLFLGNAHKIKDIVSRGKNVIKDFIIFNFFFFISGIFYIDYLFVKILPFKNRNIELVISIIIFILSVFYNLIKDKITTTIYLMKKKDKSNFFIRKKDDLLLLLVGGIFGAIIGGIITFIVTMITK